MSATPPAGFGPLRIALGALAAAAAAWPASPAAGASADHYLEKIKPVLRERCYACHGSLQQRGGLRLDTALDIWKGGESGPALAGEGAGEQSLLLSRVSSPDEDTRMPPEGHPLHPEEIEDIRAWILAGAPAPPDERGEDDPLDHWAYQPLSRPPAPEIPGGEVAAGNPIDAFLQAKRAERSLQAQPEAERPVLLRRLHLDLTGLPPGPEQLGDDRPWEVIVDELLSSPHHGERWGRHWMDIWRYSDWYGLGAQLRNSQKHLWHWRDWIVESLNADKGYDRMIWEMLAGDEIAPDDPSTLRATGFLARNYYLFNRTTWLDSTIEHTAKAFLGMTMDCAKCHDHKYDPVSQEDYYRFRAIFEPHQVRLDPLPGETDLERNGLPRVFDDHLDAPTYLHPRGDPAQADESAPLAPAVPAFLASFAPEPRPVSLPLLAHAPGLRLGVRQDHRKDALARVEAARQALDEARARLAAAPPEPDEAEAENQAAAPEGGGWIFRDDFSRPRPDLWELTGEGWEYRDGALHQTRASRDPAQLISRQPHPRDFELTARYVTTGGDTWKSVTFRFDLSEDGSEANFVYTSAHQPGPKVQVAHVRGGQSSYPSSAMAARPIELGRPVELRFAARDRLVNVWLDGELAVACLLPDRPAGNRLALSGFDATVAFESVAVRALPPDLALSPASGPAPAAPPSAADLAAATGAAEASLESALADLAALDATLAADAAAFGPGSDPASADALAREAARLQAVAALARARRDVLAREAAGEEKPLQEAKAALAIAEKALAEGGAAYQPLRASRKALETPEHKEEDYPAVYPGASTGRRSMLAAWITSPDNPLAARVAVNHVWTRRFGEPLVETVFDFGRQAPRPEHLELLDWLAAEFRDSGWSLRHLHRLMATSRLYRLTSSQAGADPATRAADPGNRYYWRMNPRRMESQIVRDSLLHAAGALDPRLGGPSLDPKQDSSRRSIYFKHSRDDQDQFLDMFDDADRLQCYRRGESIVPQQALALANSKLSLDMAGRLAARIAEGLGEPGREAFVAQAFERVLGRRPDASELAECLHFWEEVAEAGGGEESPAARESRAGSRLVHALFNHNDFITVR